MKSSELIVADLSITEDYYCYKGTFRLCNGDEHISVDLDEFDEHKLSELKEMFGLEEPVSVIRETIISKVIEGSKQESRNIQGCF